MAISLSPLPLPLLCPGSKLGSPNQSILMVDPNPNPFGLIFSYDVVNISACACIDQVNQSDTTRPMSAWSAFFLKIAIILKWKNHKSISHQQEAIEWLILPNTLDHADSIIHLSSYVIWGMSIYLFRIEYLTKLFWKIGYRKKKNFVNEKSDHVRNDIWSYFDRI